MKLLLIPTLLLTLTGCQIANTTTPKVGIKTTDRPVLTIQKTTSQQTYNLHGIEAWFNTDPIAKLEDLQGKVVMVKFWTYSCINCIRTLPYTQQWYDTYADQGFEILGIHTPEFSYERIPKNVEKAITKYGLTFPVGMDNEFKTWRSFNNRYWPAFYLLDKNGKIAYTHFGEGDYAETEAMIVKLLAE